ncbi:MAG: aminotransferase class III-fold pyridoxal phosphate-dependent enzyme, partial [Planctomycetales bacterium]|nr:aminotransferase class III-fold pyridoxal phosphate-dependent enzyme [Planctomycetales bacterium]
LADELQCIEEVRCLGAMIGIQLSVEGAPVVAECLKEGLLVNCTQQRIIRLLPALTLTDEHAAEGIEILSQALRKLESSV